MTAVLFGPLAKLGPVLVYLPFDAEKLGTIPPGIEVERFRDGDAPPASASQVEFYVPDYPLTTTAAAMIAEFPRLRIVQTLTAGVDAIVPYVRDGITLCNATGVHEASTSELAVGMMIGAQRRFADFVRAQDRNEWDYAESRSLADSNVLIVGAGSIARALESRLRPFEVEVRLVGRTARDGVEPVAALAELVGWADIVCLLVPLTPETLRLVDARVLRRMKDGALLVNVARGPVVDTDALVAELSSGRLRAALDVTDPEPLPAGHPLWSCPGVFITPHVGGASAAMWPRSYRLVAEQLRRISSGEPVLNVVDTDRATA
jgi:phosphoglycerate dehydrogenase-like enzyme